MKKGLQARLGLFAVLVMVVLGCETVGSIITHLSPSPDGRLLGVLIQERLYCVDLGSGEWREYETPPFTERRLTWSPESTSIVFASDTQGWDLYRLDLEDGALEVLAPHPAKDCWPLCGPRGDYIYFVSHRGLKPDIWALEVATGACQPLTDDDSREELLSVSRDGRLLAFAACGPSPSSPGRSTSSIWTLTLQAGVRSCAARDL
ncbi:MAG: PD40 domain-containing protein, partial [Planctomycetes bacterium]|nr:PD40 domain-containing protein [Planctomycetota bacterium]